MSFWPPKTNSAAPNPLDSARASIRDLSERGIDIPSQIATPILQVQGISDLKSASPDLQREFWSAYGALNSKIKSPEDAKRYYRRFFYGILSALLLLQLYYSAFITVQKGLLDVRDKIETAAAAPVPANAPAIKKNDLEDKRETYLNVTDYLMGIPRKIGGFLTVIGLGENEKKPKSAELVAEVELELATSFVGGFLLPVLYGMLGAIAFVLRRLSDETLAEEARTLKRKYSLRVPIGALSGLAAGWLLQPSTGSATASLSPFALAFVAGYSADLVFAAMDRFVAAFSTSTPPKPPTPTSRDGDSPTQPDPSHDHQLTADTGAPTEQPQRAEEEPSSPPSDTPMTSEAKEPVELPEPGSKLQTGK